MDTKNDSSLSSFERKVLSVVRNQRQTEDEIVARYIGYYPRNSVMKTLIPLVSSRNIIKALNILYSKKYVEKESTIFTDHLLDKDTLVFWLSEKGRGLISPKK